MRSLRLSPTAKHELRVRAEARRMAALCAAICFDLTMLATKWPLYMFPGLVEEVAEAHASVRELDGGASCPS